MNIFQILWILILGIIGIVSTYKMLQTSKHCYSKELFCINISAINDYLASLKFKTKKVDNKIIFCTSPTYFSFGEIITIEFLMHDLVRISSRPKYGMQNFDFQKNKSNVDEIVKYLN